MTRLAIGTSPVPWRITIEYQCDAARTQRPAVPPRVVGDRRPATGDRRPTRTVFPPYRAAPADHHPRPRRRARVRRDRLPCRPGATPGPRCRVIITIANRKGGGKATSAVDLAAVLGQDHSAPFWDRRDPSGGSASRSWARHARRTGRAGVASPHRTWGGSTNEWDQRCRWATRCGAVSAMSMCDLAHSWRERESAGPRPAPRRARPGRRSLRSRDVRSRRPGSADPPTGLIRRSEKLGESDVSAGRGARGLR